MITLHHPLSDRTAYIMRVGIGRAGVAIGSIVFVWLLADGYRTTYESLRTPDGWLRLLGTALACVVEWVIGAGWVIGAALWHGHDADQRDRWRRP